MQSWFMLPPWFMLPHKSWKINLLTSGKQGAFFTLHAVAKPMSNCKWLQVPPVPSLNLYRTKTKSGPDTQTFFFFKLSGGGEDKADYLFTQEMAWLWEYAISRPASPSCKLRSNKSVSRSQSPTWTIAINGQIQDSFIRMFSPWLSLQKFYSPS